jgi:hypothetical protein
MPLVTQRNAPALPRSRAFRRLAARGFRADDLGSAMQPRFVFAILAITLTFTTTIYYVRVPSDLRAGLSNKSNPGFWGQPNAEFDWCEFNYLSSFYVAEPINSFSMLSFLVVVFRLQRHFRSVLRSCPHAPLLLFEIVLVAVGSFAFHATLRYRSVPFRFRDSGRIGRPRPHRRC